MLGSKHRLDLDLGTPFSQVLLGCMQPCSQIQALLGTPAPSPAVIQNLLAYFETYRFPGAHLDCW